MSQPNSSISLMLVISAFFSIEQITELQKKWLTFQMIIVKSLAIEIADIQNLLSGYGREDLMGNKLW